MRLRDARSGRCNDMNSLSRIVEFGGRDYAQTTSGVIYGGGCRGRPPDFAPFGPRSYLRPRNNPEIIEGYTIAHRRFRLGCRSSEVP